MEKSPIIGIYLGRIHSYVSVENAKGEINVIKTDGNFGLYTSVFIQYLLGPTYEYSPVFEKCKFELIEDSGKCEIDLNYKGQIERYDLEEVCLEILRKMKEEAKNFVKTRVEDAVIIVPARFNESQRQTVTKAAKRSGLNVLKMIDASSAAVLAFDFHNDSVTFIRQTHILVFDLSDSVCNGLSVVTVDGNSVETKASADWSAFANLEEKVIQCLLDEFARRLSTVSRTNTGSKFEILFNLSMTGLRQKVKLSMGYKEFKDEGSVTLNRWKDNDADWPFSFSKDLEVLDDFLANANIGKESIYKVLAIGGPYVSLKTLQRYCSETTVKIPLAPDEALAYGATVQGSILTNPKPE